MEEGPHQLTLRVGDECSDGVVAKVEGMLAAGRAWPVSSIWSGGSHLCSGGRRHTAQPRQYADNDRCQGNKPSAHRAGGLRHVMGAAPGTNVRCGLAPETLDGCGMPETSSPRSRWPPPRADRRSVSRRRRPAAVSIKASRTVRVRRRRRAAPSVRSVRLSEAPEARAVGAEALGQLTCSASRSTPTSLPPTVRQRAQTTPLLGT